MRECKNTCLHFENVSFDFGGKIYRNGVKYCKLCNRFMKIEGNRCTCCKSNLRFKSHAKKWRTDNNEIKKEHEKIQSTQKIKSSKKYYEVLSN